MVAIGNFPVRGRVMLIRKPSDIPSSAITPKDQYIDRRRFLRGAVSGVAVAGAAALGADRLAEVMSPSLGAFAATKLDTVKSPLSTTGEELTSFKDLTTYNNYYEFGVQKNEPSQNAGVLPTRPWTVKVDGLVKKPQTFDIDALLKLRPLEDRVYRHRCVEAWSMVIPWVGYSLSEFIKQCDPLPKAKYIQFLSYYDKKVEKWAKSIVGVRFLEKQPPTTWNDQNASEYGFYSNVNPNVDHPRWSQKTERRIGQPFYAQRRTTLMFNGYGEQVASLYNGMDLKKYY